MQKIAAIVSAYYASRFIDGRIKDLLKQIPAPLVVVIAQSDSYEADLVLKSYGDNPLVQLILTADVPTVYQAWNIGIENSESEYITNANSDDRLYDHALRLLSKTLDRQSDQAVAYFDIDRVEEIGSIPVGQFIWREGGIKELLGGCFVGPMPMWRRSLHTKYGPFNADFKSAGDYEFWMRIAAQGEKFKHIHGVHGAHLERPDALEHRSPLRTTWETARARSLYRGFA